MLDHLLTQRATIQARGAAAIASRDRFGQPVDEPWTAKAADVPCRLTVARGAERFGERTRDQVHITHKVYLPADTAVVESDRISQITDGDGTVLVTDLDVLLVAPAAGLSGALHHLEVGCQIIRGTNG